MSRPVIALRSMAAAFWAGAAFLPPAASALDLAFPGPAETTAHRAEDLTSYRLAIGPFAAGSLPTQLAEGALDQTAYRIPLDDPSTLELSKQLRDQIAAAGFEVLFECETDACGGFDFRFGTDVLPEPDMHVDLGDFRYIAARRGKDDAKAEYLGLLISRSAQEAFVQVTRIAGDSAAETPAIANAAPKPQIAAEPSAQPTVLRGQSVPGLEALGNRLELGQSQVLEDLVFPSGSSRLADGDYVSLKALAAWLLVDNRRRVTLVGHTDASGGLAGNLKLSQLRAESVRQHLLYSFKIPPEQISAEGVGYLSPRDSNQTEEGRQRNRRVEVIPTSTELLAP